MELKEHCKHRFAPVVSALKDLIENTDSDPIIVGIDGRCASGKTTLGFYLTDLFDCNLFHVDDFFLRASQRTEERLAEVGGNVDYERFKETVVDPILAGKQIVYQPFDCHSMSLKESTIIQPKRVNIIEGSYSHHHYFGDIYDLKVVTDIDADTQQKNIIKRNGIEQLKDFNDKWIPKEEAYFKKFNIGADALKIMW